MNLLELYHTKLSYLLRWLTNRFSKPQLIQWFDKSEISDVADLNELNRAGPRLSVELRRSVVDLIELDSAEDRLSVVAVVADWIELDRAEEDRLFNTCGCFVNDVPPSENDDFAPKDGRTLVHLLPDA